MAGLRKATLKDLDVLVLHRRKMWEAMASHTKGELDAADRVYRPWLRARIKSGRAYAAIIETPSGQAAASGVMWLQEAHPRPAWKGVQLGYLMSMYTDPRHRRKGYARRIVTATVKWAKEQGVDRIALHASDQGMNVYAAAGFRRTHEMRLLVSKPARRKR